MILFCIYMIMYCIYVNYVFAALKPTYHASPFFIKHDSWSASLRSEECSTLLRAGSWLLCLSLAVIYAQIEKKYDYVLHIYDYVLHLY